MTEDLFERRPGEPMTDYAQRMLDLIQFAKSRVEFELGRGIDIDDMLDEMREIIAGDGKAVAVREVRQALEFARPYFPRLEMPAYPSDNDLIEAALEIVRLHETAGYDIDERGMAVLRDIEIKRRRPDEHIVPELSDEEIKALLDASGGPLVITPENLSESVMERLQAQADKYPHAELEIVGGDGTGDLA